MPRKKHVRPAGDEDVKIYPDVPPITGTYHTQAVSDPTRRYSQTNAARPSDRDVADNRAWVEENEK